MTGGRLAAALVLGLACAAPVQAGGDLLYTYRPIEIATLKSYDNQPYWRVLAQCAGIHGALANQYEAAGRAQDYEAARARGVSFMRLATERIRVDRGLTDGAARELAAEEVDAGRSAGRTLLASRPNRNYSHEQMIDVLCTQVSERHEKAARRR